jgi:hypothetical protein
MIFLNILQSKMFKKIIPSSHPPFSAATLRIKWFLTPYSH